MVSGDPKTQFDAMNAQFRRNWATKCLSGNGLDAPAKTQFGRRTCNSAPIPQPYSCTPMAVPPTCIFASRLPAPQRERDPRIGRLRFIEVKGRVAAADTITATRNEILTSLNKPDDYILAIVEFLGGDHSRVHYVRRPFRREPDFGVTSVNYALAELLARAEEPA